ncbi:MAG: Uma2 family endonuclease [Gemmatimonadota bacterium]
MALPQITWQDVQQLPDDGNRYEAIEGELYVTPAPTVRHQRISRRLERALDPLLTDAGHGEILHAPVGVEFPATSEGVQPDIVFISRARRSIVGEDWIRGAPDLVVEILSPTTAHRDRGVKLKLYDRQGVEEYWIVDPDGDSVEVWRFQGEPRFERFTERLPVRLGGEMIGEINLSQIFLRDRRAGG